MRISLIFSLLFSFVFAELNSNVTVVELSGNATEVIDLLQAVIAASQRENINQQFRVRTVGGNIVMESADYKPGALEQLDKADN